MWEGGHLACMLPGSECSPWPCDPSQPLGHRLPLLQPALLSLAGEPGLTPLGKPWHRKRREFHWGNSSHFLGNCTSDQFLSQGPCLSYTTAHTRPCICCPSPTAPSGLHPWLSHHSALARCFQGSVLGMVTNPALKITWALGVKQLMDKDTDLGTSQEGAPAQCVASQALLRNA